MSFIFYNLVIGLINVILILAINIATRIRKRKTIILKNKVLVYFVLFILFSIPIINIVFLYLIIKGLIIND